MVSDSLIRWGWLLSLARKTAIIWKNIILLTKFLKDSEHLAMHMYIVIVYIWPIALQYLSHANMLWLKIIIWINIKGVM